MMKKTFIFLSKQIPLEFYQNKILYSSLQNAPVAQRYDKIHWAGVDLYLYEK